MLLRYAIEQQASVAGIPVQTSQVSTMFGLYFNDHPVTTYAEVKQSDTERYACFFHAMLKEGVYFAPSAFEAAFATLPHEGPALDQTLSAIKMNLSKSIMNSFQYVTPAA